MGPAGRRAGRIGSVRQVTDGLDALPRLDYMTSERSKAYGRVMQTIDHVGPAKLSPAEADRIRTAADALFFCEDLGSDADAREAVADMTRLCRTLVESERWLDDTARRLLDDVMACGPLVAAGR